MGQGDILDGILEVLKSIFMKCFLFGFRIMIFVKKARSIFA